MNVIYQDLNLFYLTRCSKIHAVEKLNLSIAGFHIILALYETEYLQTKKIFVDQISSVYGGFIQKKVPSKVDFTIHVRQKNYVNIRKSNKDNEVQYYHVENSRKVIETYYTISLHQLALILHNVLGHLLRKSGFFLHASACINMRQRVGYLFLGQSGSGKSTILELLKGKYFAFADDAIIVRKLGSKFYCFQTPMLDKQLWIKKTSSGFLISSIFVLKKSAQNSIDQLNTNLGLKLATKSLFTNTSNHYSSLTNWMNYMSKNNEKIRSLSFNLDENKLADCLSKQSED